MKKSGGRCSSGEPVPESEVARGCLPAEGVWASEGGARGALQARWQVSLTAWELVRRSGAHRSGAQQERDCSLPWGRVGNCREAQSGGERAGGVREAGRQGGGPQQDAAVPTSSVSSGSGVTGVRGTCRCGRRLWP